MKIIFSFMFNIFIIIISSFLLIACSEEQDSSNNQKHNLENSIVAPEVTPEEIPPNFHEKEMEILIPKIENTEDVSNNNDRWGTIVEGANDSSIDENNLSNSSISITIDNNLASKTENLEDIKSNVNLTNNEIVEEVTFKVNKNDIVLGDRHSPVVLIEYYSPTCPHCAYYNKEILPELKKRYTETNKIAYVIREFIGNKQDLDAAILQRCQNNYDSFLKFHKIILEQQDKWAVNNNYRMLLTNIGQVGGVSAEDYAKCLKDDKMIQMLIANTNLANSASNFVGTPAFFINGVQITDGYSLENLSKKLDKALE